MASPRILIVDDHEIVREGIRTLIQRSRPDWEICGEASNAADAIEAVKKLEPDVVVLDVTMPGMSGLEAAPRIKKLELRSRILIFTMHDSSRLSTEVRDAGADGYVLKSQASRDLVAAIECLLEGGTFFGSSAPTQDKRDDTPGAALLLCKALEFGLMLGGFPLRFVPGES